jgi:hypothetical protein
LTGKEAGACDESDGNGENALVVEEVDCGACCDDEQMQAMELVAFLVEALKKSANLGPLLLVQAHSQSRLS